MSKNTALKLSCMVTVQRLLTIFTNGLELCVKLILFFLIVYQIEVLGRYLEEIMVFVEMLEFKAEF